MTPRPILSLLASLLLGAALLPAQAPTPARKHSATPPTVGSVPDGGPTSSSTARPQVTVRTASLQSAALGRAMQYRVLLPASYDSSMQRYPVLYLLHGLTGDYTDWESRTRLTEYLRHYDLIVVTPDANDSWYTNSAGDPADRFEDYIATDLIAEIDRTYRTLATRHGRAIAGLSMGGYGAMKFALRHPGQFAFAGSFSGALRFAHDPQTVSTGDEKRRANILKILGPTATSPDNDVFALAEKAEPARLPYLYLDCGTEDALLPVNREFILLLNKKKIAYEYREIPGGHNWQYWDQQVRGMLEVLAAHVRIARDRPRFEDDRPPPHR